MTDLRGGENEKIAALNVLQIGGRHRHPLQSILRRIYRFLRAFACGVEADIVHLVVFAVHMVVFVDGLHAGGALVSVAAQRLLKLALFGGKTADDFFRRERGAEVSMTPKPSSCCMGVNLFSFCAAAVRASPAASNAKPIDCAWFEFPPRSNPWSSSRLEPHAGF